MANEHIVSSSAAEETARFMITSCIHEIAKKIDTKIKGTVTMTFHVRNECSSNHINKNFNYFAYK